MAIRCLLVDDNEHFLRSASHFLERERINVLGVAATSAEALQQASNSNLTWRSSTSCSAANSAQTWRATLAQTVPDPPHMIMISAYGENDPRAGVSLALQAAALGYRLRGALAWGRARRAPVSLTARWPGSPAPPAGCVPGHGVCSVSPAPSPVGSAGDRSATDHVEVRPCSRAATATGHRVGQFVASWHVLRGP
jgi:CheY-like chemotaxis protein